jgi:hypothetical protein
MTLSIQIVVDVTGESAGTPGVARTFDYTKLGTSPTVTLSLDDTTGVTSYYWEFVDVPVGSSSSLSSSTTAEPTFDPDVVGTYLVQCTANSGEAYARNAVAFTTQYQGLRKPAAGETNEFDVVSGWRAAIDELFDTADGSSSTDSDAIHDNIDGEINAVSAKGSPVNNDLFLIEDSESSYSKKKVSLSALESVLTHTDSDAIHDNVNGEINAVSPKGSPVTSDLLLIEDSGDTYSKKKITLGDIDDIVTHTDSDAIHDNVNGEIAAIDLKSSLSTSDIVLIEDSGDSNNKKRTTVNDIISLASGGGGVPASSIEIGSGNYAYTQAASPVEEVCGNGSFDGLLIDGASVDAYFKAAVTNVFDSSGNTKVRLYDLGPASGPLDASPRQVSELTFTTNGGPLSSEQVLTVVSGSPSSNEILNSDRMYEIAVIQDASTEGDNAYVGSACLEVK